MAYTELEQFLGRGEEKVFWILSLKSIGGLAVGGFLGQRLGLLLFGHGLGAMGTTLALAGLGLVLMLQYRGLIVARRLVIRGAWYVRAIHPVVIDGTHFDGTASDVVVGQPGLNERVRVRGAAGRQPIFALNVAGDVSPALIRQPDGVGTTSDGRSV